MGRLTPDGEVAKFYGCLAAQAGFYSSLLESEGYLVTVEPSEPLTDEKEKNDVMA